ncbi:HutD/Ves family protein [Frateuria aurantia]
MSWPGTDGSSDIPRLLRAGALLARAWKNGGGMTREIACEPAGAGLDHFDWRISVAEIAKSGPFSLYEGVDRQLVLLEGEGMHLLPACGVSQSLEAPMAMAHFAGEMPMYAELRSGPTRDFNLMLRRGRWHGRIERWAAGVTAGLTADVLLLFCTGAAMTVMSGEHHGCMLHPDDSLLFTAPTALISRVAGKGELLAVILDRDRASR